ncbi:hypothetical protein BC834DRAFT_825303 [Gloeopeniophorella convolvens]|nr:hypothetical protein BC834DRAFT_825303 [Gloeopeniophorella convolvens]
MSSPHDPSTPQREHASSPRRKTAASFENLVVLANYEEHLREARKIIWRDRGEPGVDIRGIKECLVHGTRGGLRASTVAFAIRSGVNLILLLTRIRKIQKVKGRLILIRHALFGPDSFRAAAMMGSFVALYRIILNALPLLFPADIPLRESIRKLFSQASHPAREDGGSALDDSPPLSTPSTSPGSLGTSPGDKREARLSLSAQARQTWVRKKTRRWHSVLAGSVAGAIAISFEKRSRQSAMAQQLFVRGLQGSYNAYSEKRGFRIPHGNVLVFGLAIGQILYAYMLSPQTLGSYQAWITGAACVPRELTTMYYSVFRHGTYDPADLARVLARPDLHPDNAARLARWSAQLPLPPYALCAVAHPSTPHCLAVPPSRFLTVARRMLPVYGALHFVPLLLFKHVAFARAPARMAARTALGTLRSSAFLAVMVIVYQSWLCGMQNAHRALSARGRAVPVWLLAAVLSRPMHWMAGVAAGVLSLLVEAKHRRSELAMYALPKALESAWLILRGRGLVLHTGKYGNSLLTSVAMGMVMSAYQNDPQHLSGLVRRVLYQFVGPN